MRHIFFTILLLVFTINGNLKAQVASDSLKTKSGKGDLELLAKRMKDAFNIYISGRDTVARNEEKPAPIKHSNSNTKGLVLHHSVPIKTIPLVVEDNGEGDNILSIPLGVPLTEEKMQTSIDNIESIKVFYGPIYSALYGLRAGPCYIKVKFKEKESK